MESYLLFFAYYAVLQGTFSFSYAHLCTLTGNICVFFARAGFTRMNASSPARHMPLYASPPLREFLYSLGVAPHMRLKAERNTVTEL